MVRAQNTGAVTWVMAGLLLCSLLLAGCDVLLAMRGDSSPEAVQQTIEAISTRYTPELPEQTPPAFTASPTRMQVSANTSTLPATGTPTPTACQQTQGSVELREILLPGTQPPLGFRVYLPACYDQQTDLRYPVLYLLHGQNQKDDQWDRLGVDETADRLIAAGEAPPFIIVMPWEVKSSEDDKVSTFGSSIVEQLIPWMDSEYRTCPLRECRAIGGITRGAGWAMRLGFIHWEKFGAIGVHSFTPFSGDFYTAPYWFQAVENRQFPRIYMDMGSEDGYMDNASLFEQRLTKYHIPHEWVIRPGTHNDAYWSAHVESYLRWYTFPWRQMYAGPEAGYQTLTPTPTGGTEEAGS